jgi:NADPH-dependent 2,4-dienoyl-CoA reductase/sulfur reductase-like enzyme
MVSRELELKPLLVRKPQPRKVVVVGSGAAGLSAALTAARRGHDVHLFEKDSVVGGQLLLAHQQPHRGEIWNALRYFTSEIKRLGIPINLNRSFSADDALALKPEVIIVATGAAPVHTDGPGSNLPHALSGWRVIAGLDRTGQTCVVVAGGLVGI